MRSVLLYTLAAMCSTEASVSSSTVSFDPVGTTIQLAFPNKQTILGIGGLVYNKDINTWTGCSENIVSSDLDDAHPGASLPRLWHMQLDFTNGTVDFVTDEAVTIDPSNALKLEDIAAVPNTNIHLDPLERDVWLVSEANSHLIKTNVFLSKDFGAPDLSTFDSDTFSNSRLIRVDARTGVILEEVELPDFTQWDQDFNWDGNQCVGNRPFQGAHALSIVPSTDPNYDYKLYVGFQSALFQDGAPPREFSSSSTRMLVFGINAYDSVNERTEPTSKFLKTHRYDTSALTIKSYQKGARHFNALFGMLALDESRFLMLECEDFYGFGKNQQKIINRIFYVEIDPNDTIDHCSTLINDCSVNPPLKRLVWEREDKLQLDGIGWGPEWKDGRKTVALTFENDFDIGLHIELYALNTDELKSGQVWQLNDSIDNIRQSRLNAFFIGTILFIFFALTQRCLVSLIEKKDKAEAVRFGNTIVSKGGSSIFSLSSYVVSDKWISYYAIGTAITNSFLVGGLTFGYSGMALILRKEGVYSGSCACGSFCAKQKEDFALVSTVGFAAAIGSRLFVGLFMDKQGPKTTAILCSLTCLTAFLLLAIPNEEELDTYFLPAWILLSIGGSGLHLTGFHFTNLFRADGKKLASVAISAAFGASSAIFPLMQVFSQYLEVKLKSMAIVYAVIVFIIGANNLLIQPWDKITSGSPHKVSFEIYKKEWWVRDLKTKPFLRSIFMEVLKFDFYGEMLCYTFCLLLLTHYISTSGQLMHELGDSSFSNAPNAWTDYIVARMAGWFNALGFVWFPLVQIILLKFQWAQCYQILTVVNVVIFIIILIRNLTIQILGFSLLSFARLFLFSCHHTYILDKFGVEFFGTLNGISSLFAAIVGFISYPLQLFALKTNYSFSFVPIGVCVVLTFIFPVVSSRRRFLNWAETVSVDPVKFRYPRNTEEVKELVSTNKKIRCAGAMHSCAPLIASEGIIMSLTKMDKILDIDAENMTVRCESGVRIHNLCEALVPYGLAVGTLGTIDWQTLSGAVMTGTHGGGLTVPSLHTFVTSYTIVKADASIITVSKESNPELFSAVAPSMGVFGVVVEMEMQCVPLQMLEARLKVITFDELASESVFEDLMKENKYARVVVYPSINQATVWYANPISKEEVDKAIEDGAVDSTGGYMNFRDENEKAWLEQFVILDKMKKYEEADILLYKVLESQQSRLGRYVGRYNHILCKERNNGIPHADIEFNFDFKRNLDVLRLVRKYCNQNRMPYYNFEMRTTRQDDAMLSCCNSRDAMWIDFQAKAADSSAFFATIEAVLKPIGFRKHWAKGLGNTDPSYVITQFPMMGKFVKLMEELDPEGKFRNVEGELWYQEMSELVEELETENEELPPGRGSILGRRWSLTSVGSRRGSLRRGSLRRGSLISGGLRRGSMSGSMSESVGLMSSSRRRSSLLSGMHSRNEAVAYELADFMDDNDNAHIHHNVEANLEPDVSPENSLPVQISEEDTT